MSRWETIYANKKELLKLRKYVENEIAEWQRFLKDIDKKLGLKDVPFAIKKGWKLFLLWRKGKKRFTNTKIKNFNYGRTKKRSRVKVVDDDNTS